MSNYIENKNYESSSLFTNASEEARKSFEETLVYAGTMPLRGANIAPDAGVVFKVSGLPKKVDILDNDKKKTGSWIRIPVASKDGEFEGGMSLSRFQGHPSKKFWDKPHKLIEVASNKVLEVCGAIVHPAENGESIIDVSNLKPGWSVYRASNVAVIALHQLIEQPGQYVIIATTVVVGTRYTTKHSLILKCESTTIPFPTKRDNSDYGNEGRGFPLNRLQEHLKPKIQNKGKVELIDIASTDIPGKFGVSAKPSSVVRCNIEVNLKVEGPVSIYGTCCSHAL